MSIKFLTRIINWSVLTILMVLTESLKPDTLVKNDQKNFYSIGLQSPSQAYARYVKNFAPTSRSGRFTFDSYSFKVVH